MKNQSHLSTHLIWFRQDLRIDDHAALWHATQAGACMGLVILSPEQWEKHYEAAVKIDLYLRQLKTLKLQLEQLNIPLVVLTVPLWKDISSEILKLTHQHHIQKIYANIECGTNEIKRDHAVQVIIEQSSKEFLLFNDRTLFPLGSIRNKSGHPYQVFSAFKKVCYERLSISLPQSFSTPTAQDSSFDIANQSTQIPSLEDLGFPSIDPKIPKIWRDGTNIAKNHLYQFIDQNLTTYHTTRDIPALVGTSRLSPYLNMGTISIRQCLNSIFSQQQRDFVIENQGQHAWLDELLWREFYQHLLFDYPKLSQHEPFKDKTKHIVWRNDEKDFKAWSIGQTGIPIVDAGMRELLATGWMHNRVRMICAMFLNKNLLIDWRKGEQWFMQHLIDGDLAANNGGWQWCASTGTDSVPYFRIFNPISQSKKIDPKAEYLRKWLPELAHLDHKMIHEPYAQDVDLELNYPKPIVNLAESRARALRVFKINS